MYADSVGADDGAVGRVDHSRRICAARSLRGADDQAVGADARAGVGRVLDLRAGSAVDVAGADNRIVGAQTAADANAGVRARDEEEACAVSVADADVFDRSGLADRQVGRLGGGDGDQRGSRAQKNSLSKPHIYTLQRMGCSDRRAGPLLFAPCEARDQRKAQPIRSVATIAAHHCHVKRYDLCLTSNCLAMWQSCHFARISLALNGQRAHRARRARRRS